MNAEQKKQHDLNWIKWKQEDLERLQDDFHWPYWGSQELMICINNRQTGETAGRWKRHQSPESDTQW